LTTHERAGHRKGDRARKLNPPPIAVSPGTSNRFNLKCCGVHEADVGWWGKSHDGWNIDLIL